MDDAAAIVLSNAYCAITLDRRTGALLGIKNTALHDTVLAPAGGSPFRIHADFERAWLLDTDPEAAAAAHVSPGAMQVASVRRSANASEERVRVRSAGGGFACELQVALDRASGESSWTLRVTNTGSRPRDVIVDFPRLEGVQPGPDGAPLRDTRMDMTGQIVPAWSYPGGIYGNGGEWSMQWHAVYDPGTGSSLGMIVEDPAAGAKRLVLARPNVLVRGFPPRRLEPGASMTLPPVRLVVSSAGWKPTAHAYARWSSRALRSIPSPRWVRAMDVLFSGHFHKTKPGARPGADGQFVLDSFRDLPEAHLQSPYDAVEYAFWARGAQLYGVHTDGDNVVRDDLGGPDGLRDAVRELQRLGLHTTLYVEGYIVPQRSDLAREGKAERWQVVHHDGSTAGGYTGEGFLHMCAGCAEWQDRLAGVVSRILRETGADGIRLDSLGFNFLPCYNREHHHAAPFDYNEWMKQLLAKVRAAAVAVNPNAYLTTEAPVDFYGRWFHGALTDPSRSTLDGRIAFVREVPPMRLAVAPYRAVLWWPGGPVWASVMGMAGGGGSLNWICAQEPVHETLVYGAIDDADPACTDPKVATRRFTSTRCDVIAAVRYEVRDRWWRVVASDAACELAIPGYAAGSGPVAVCDIETLTWSAVQPRVRGGRATVSLRANWALAVVPHAGERVVHFGALPEVHPGAELSIRPETLVGAPGPVAIEVIAPGLAVGPRCGGRSRAHTGDAVRIRVPHGTRPGWYSIRIAGAGVLGVRRLLRVLPAP